MYRTVLWFVALMFEKLDQNRFKMGWDGCTQNWLLDRLEQEVGELRQAITDNKPARDIAYEAADVANFAMMIADNSGAYQAAE